MKPCQSNKNQSTQIRGKTRNKMGEQTSKKTKEPPKRADHKGNLKFLNPLQLQEAYQIMKEEDRLKGLKNFGLA